MKKKQMRKLFNRTENFVVRPEFVTVGPDGTVLIRDPLLAKLIAERHCGDYRVVISYHALKEVCGGVLRVYGDQGFAESSSMFSGPTGGGTTNPPKPLTVC